MEERERESLAAETVQSAALSLESVHDVEGRDGLPLRVLGVGDCVSDDAFEEGLEDAAGFFVDHCLCRTLVFACFATCLLDVKVERGRDDGRATYWQRYA